MNYKVIIPNTSKMGSQCFDVMEKWDTEFKEWSALYVYNQKRSMHKLGPINKLPAGTQFILVS